MKKLFVFIGSALFAGGLSIMPAQAADYTNSIGMQFKNIPAGSFYRGSCRSLNEAQRKANKKRKVLGKPLLKAVCPSGAALDNWAGTDETPQRKIRISKGFQIGIHEVTFGQFRKFLVAADRDDLVTDEFVEANDYGDRAPVTAVSWNDAQDFISWLNKKEGGRRYRLPTEAEWEYAARAGTTTRFSWGDNSRRAGDYAWFYGNSGGRHHPVGQKKPNPWGLYDMHGNVWEWVADWYGERYYDTSPSTDPAGPSSGRNRVLRGGSRNYVAWFLRSANRGDFSPGNRGVNPGLRLVRQP